MKAISLFGASALAILMSSPAMAQTNAAADEVVVTATKREQTLQEVPISVAVVSGEQIANAGVVLFNDLQASVPNLQIDQTNGNFAITMRGLGAGTGNLSFEQSVGLFVDGVYLSRSRSFMNPLLDVERVEVVRGPQGALFGKNTNAGAVSIITRRPTKEFEANLRTGYELEYGGWNVEGAVSGAVAPTLMGRLTVRAGEVGDYIYNAAQNRDENGSQYEAIRGQLLWEPTESFDALLKIERSEINIDGGATMYNFIGNAGCVLCDAARTQGGPRVQVYPGFYRTSRSINPEFDDTEASNATLTMNWDVGGWTFTSVTAYQQLESAQNVDVDGGVLTYLDSLLWEKSSSLFQEVRAQREWDNGAILIAGVTYIDTDLHVGQASTYAAATVPVPGPFNGTTTRRFWQDGKSWSPFVFVEVPVAEKISLSGSLRYSSEERTGNAVHVRDPGLPPTWLPYNITEERSESLVDYSLRARYEFNTNASVYMSYATGTKGGGFISNDALLLTNIINGIDTFQYEDESAKSLELGGKFRLFDGAARLNVAIFRTEFSDLQVSEYNGTAFVTGNAAQAISQGVEVDGDVRFGEHWRVGGSVGYLDATYDDYPGGQCLWNAPITCSPVTNNLAGATLVRAPEWKGSVFLEASYPVTDNYFVSGRLSANHQSLSFFQPDQHPLNAQPAFTKYDARLAFGSSGGPWELALIGRNLTNEVTTSQGFNTPVFGGNSHMALVGQPRTVTLELSFDF